MAGDGWRSVRDPPLARTGRVQAAAAPTIARRPADRAAQPYQPAGRTRRFGSHRLQARDWSISWLGQGAGMVRSLTLPAVVAFSLQLAGLAWAQEQRAAIEGIVRDTQGLAVPGVAVLASAASGLTLETVTDDSGTYRFATLPP